MSMLTLKLVIFESLQYINKYLFLLIEIIVVMIPILLLLINLQK